MLFEKKTFRVSFCMAFSDQVAHILTCHVKRVYVTMNKYQGLFRTVTESHGQMLDEIPGFQGPV